MFRNFLGPLAFPATGGVLTALGVFALLLQNLLVGVPSTEVPAILRVKPGDPDNSYIIQKLEGHASVGARMPFGGPYLTSDTVAFMRQWISNGAPAATTSAVQTAGKFAGFGGVYEPELMKNYIGLGMHMILCGSDISLLLAAAQDRARFVRGCAP